jgi:RNA polymerase sigma-70 factor (ECF subfamily)
MRLPSTDPGAGSNVSKSTSLSLLQRVKVRDRDAWQRLADLYGPLVYRWCRQRGISSTDSQDVVQEVFRAVATGIGRFQRDPAQGSFRAWLWTIARNEVRDHFSRRGKQPLAIGGTGLQATLLHIPEECPDDGPPEAPGDLAILMRRAVEAIRGDFHERTWQAFWRTTIEGQAAADVALDLGMTPRGVRQAKHRVLQRLRDEYRDLIDGLPG